jgi:arabinose-5-phosphate isomerase
MSDTALRKAPISPYAVPGDPAKQEDAQVLACARRVIRGEIMGISALKSVLNDTFIRAVRRILACEGKVVASGVGKSGHIARKISATLSSTGTPSVFVHPTEASHGDLGMIGRGDIVLLLSNSGETRELEDVIAYCKRFGIPIIGVVRRSLSMLAQAADYAFVLPDIPEVTPVNAPTTSSTMMLVWGDVLAVSVMEMRGFGRDDFGVLHPGGKLGSRLKKVGSVMITGADMPAVRESDLMSAVLIEMTKKSLGCAVVLDENGKMAGLITDGDLRRHMCDDLVKKTARDLMYRPFIRVHPEMLGAEALKIMSDRKIANMPVSSDGRTLEGIVHMQMLLAAGVY